MVVLARSLPSVILAVSSATVASDSFSSAKPSPDSSVPLARAMRVAFSPSGRLVRVAIVPPAGASMSASMRKAPEALRVRRASILSPAPSRGRAVSASSNVRVFGRLKLPSISKAALGPATPSCSNNSSIASVSSDTAQLLEPEGFCSSRRLRIGRRMTLILSAPIRSSFTVRDTRRAGDQARSMPSAVSHTPSSSDMVRRATDIWSSGSPRSPSISTVPSGPASRPSICASRKARPPLEAIQMRAAIRIVHRTSKTDSAAITQRRLRTMPRRE